MIFEVSTNNYSMNRFRSIQTTNNKANFSTSSKQYIDEDFYYERNKHITDNSEKIEAVSDSPVDKSLTNDTLQDQLNNNWEQINSNMRSTKDVYKEAAKVAKVQSTLYLKHKSKLTESQQKTVGENIGINSTVYDHGPAETSEADKAFSNITRGQKLLTDSMYKVNTLRESLPQDKSRFT